MVYISWNSAFFLNWIYGVVNGDQFMDAQAGLRS